MCPFASSLLASPASEELALDEAEQLAMKTVDKTC